LAPQKTGKVRIAKLKLLHFSRSIGTDASDGECVAMKARAPIGGASFGPEAVKAIGQAFDEAWTEIAHHFGEDPVIQETARLSLANAILSVATETSRDVEVLKKAGVQVMALNYKS